MRYTALVKKIACLLMMSLSSNLLVAQFGINIGYKFTEAKQWQIVADQYITKSNFKVLKAGTTAGIDYNFPTKSSFFRIQPNIQFTRLTSSLLHHTTRQTYDFDLFNFSFQCNLNFYLIRFKDKTPQSLDDIEPQLGKYGFWVQFSPAIDHFRTEYTHPVINDGGTSVDFIKSGAVYFNYSLGFRTGVDLACSQLFSISPFVGFRYFPRVDWKDLTEITTEGEESGIYDFSALTQFSIGIRIGFDLEED